MIRFLPFLLILQGFCLWHAYSRRADNKWFWIILVVPVLGSVFYLIEHFYNRENIEVLSETVKGAINSNHRIEHLEKEVEFSNSILNRTNLADAYTDLGRYKEAIELYESCLTDFNIENVDVIKKLVYCCFQISDFPHVVNYGEKIENQKAFRNASERIAYAWALYESNELERAEQNFIGMESRYSNYTHRKEYAKFLEMTERKPEAIEKLEGLMSELSKMNSGELRSWRQEQREIQSLYADYTR